MQGMTLIVKKISQIMAPSIFVLGFYVISHGHLTPGGGFAGGVLIAGCFVLLILAYGSEKAKSLIYKERASLIESSGIFVFLFIALLGLIQGAYFFLNVFSKTNPGVHAGALFSGGIIPLCNFAIGIEVAAALFAIFISFAIVRVGEKL